MAAVCLFAGGLLLFCCQLQVSAADTARRMVKVGVLNHTIYADQDKNGAWSGMDIECMMNIAQREGFDLTFVDSSDDPEFMEGLDQGRYDIVADIVRTSDREQQYLFTDEAIGNINNTLSVRASDDRWDYGDIEQLSRMRIGVLGTYANNADFRDWCTRHQVTPTIREYPTMEEMMAALDNDEIDGEVYSAVYGDADQTKYRTVMKFLPEAFYYAFRKDDTQLKNAVDDAISQILVSNINYLTEVKNKYDTQDSTNILPLSAKEKNYISSHPVLKVAVIADDAPYFKQEGKGPVQGIIPDYYSLIAEKSGLQFTYRVYPTHEAAVAAVKNKEADILGMYSGGMVSSYEKGLILTDRFSTVNSILLTKSGLEASEIRKIAVKSRALDSLKGNISETFPSAQVIDYENAQECFNAMQRGETDAVLIGLPSATWLINQVNSAAYSIVPLPGTSSDLCGAVNKDNQILSSILNKEIGATMGNFPGIVTKDTLTEGSWKTSILRIPPVMLVLIVGFLLALVLLLIWALIMLRRRQRERTAILAAQAETERQKMQVEAIQKNAEERNQFFANISHDMRTPLNAITGFIRLARKENIEPQERRDYLEKAEASSKLLLDLINDTLTVSKLSSGRLELKPVPCHTSALIGAIAYPIRAAAEAKRITFTVDTTSMQDCVILADQLNLEKIFLNLLTNAVKFTPEGGHVWCSVVQTRSQDGQLAYCITIRDNGIGISEAFLPHLFEAFAQEKRHGYESVGTGLGLSIVKQLVDLMGGTITVDSKVGEGTAFVVRLQFPEAPQQTQEQTEGQTEEQTEGQTEEQADSISGAAFSAGESAGQQDDLSGRKILLCEDNKLNREIATALLRDQGMEVVSAENGEDGLRLFRESAPDEFALILMDIRMPVMDGYETAKEIRALDRPDADVPMIAMSADAFADDIKRCMAAGMNGHVAKPVDPDLLYQAIRRFCRKT